jgi:hypothetical protein
MSSATVIELRNGKVGSLQMFPADTAKLLEFLQSATVRRG